MPKEREDPTRKGTETVAVPDRRTQLGPDVPIGAGPLARGLLVDCYKLNERLGAGFSAEVWSATVDRVPPGTELSHNQEVALKFYHAYAMALPDQVFRIEREYRIAQSIRHPHLIRIYEFVLASPRPHHNFLVMDIARGMSLRKLAESRSLTTRQVMTVLHQILSALDALHAAGALHRDIKPGNITVEAEDDSVHSTLLDLGIVNITYEKGLTGVSHFLGSKHWAPIEQLLGENLDEQSDLYGVGAVAFHALTGQIPYGESATEAAVAVRMGNESLVLPPLPDLPKEVAQMVAACLSYRREERPRSARECLDILERHL
jgi:serine/threonine-protein kinase